MKRSGSSSSARKRSIEPKYFDSLEELLTDISRNDLGCEGKITFIYSGNNSLPDTGAVDRQLQPAGPQRRVVLGYDRNDKTVEAFREAGFSVVSREGAAGTSLSKEYQSYQPVRYRDPDALGRTISRARGGFHCMSMPLLREEI